MRALHPALTNAAKTLIMPNLTNKEASTVLCSVVKLTESGRARKKV